jgi:Tfp pilus assembly protein PilW
MTTITTQCKERRGGFTLVEMLIGCSLATVLMIGVLSTFLMLGRSGANVANYSMAETESRHALEELSQDVRMAEDITWNSAQSVTLKVPDNYMSTNNRVTYAYDTTTKEFYRKPGFVSSTEPRRILVNSVASCTFARFNRLNVATKVTDITTKRLQITLVVRRKSQTVAAATNTILSASYILRNKPTN